MGREIRRRARVRVGAFLLALFVLFPPAAFANAYPGGTPPDPSAEETAPGADTAAAPTSRLIPPRFCTRGFVYLPRIYYAEERGWGAGGQILYAFRCSADDPGIRFSDVRVDGRITEKGQGRAGITVDWIGGRGAWGVKTRLEYDALALRFWGSGSDAPAENEEVYRHQSLETYLEISRRIRPCCRVGVRVEAQSLRYLEREEGGLLATEPYPGLGPSTVAGAGAIFEWDSRDRRYDPRLGFYYQGFALFFDEKIGGDWNFNNYHLDLRHYVPFPGWDHRLATQFFLYAAKGYPPIWRLAALGGRAHSRGYRKARYLDEVLIAYQAEYRFPIFRRLDGALFGGFANVAASFNRLRIDRMRPTLGGGLRLRPGPEKQIPIRFDVAFGESSVRFDLSLGEAF